MRFSVVIASTGRPETLRSTLASLRAPSNQPNEIIVVVADPSDAQTEIGACRVIVGPRGLTAQRNAGIAVGLEGRPDLVPFLDYDVLLHPAYVKNAKVAFSRGAA